MKTYRLRTLLPEDGRRVLLTPMDHGVTQGPIDGLQDMAASLRFLKRTGRVQGVILHKGILEQQAAVLAEPPALPVLLHLSASTDLGPHADWKVLVSTVEDALRLGATGVSVHVNLGNEHEPDMLRSLGRTASRCQAWGLPLLAMVYLRGDGPAGTDASTLARLLRVPVELGADLIKVDYPGNREEFAEALASVPLPVLVAGGALSGDHRTILSNVADAVSAGAAGVAMGRNIFQRGGNGAFVHAVDAIMNEGVSLEEACRIAEGTSEGGAADV